MSRLPKQKATIAETRLPVSHCCSPRGSTPGLLWTEVGPRHGRVIHGEGLTRGSRDRESLQPDSTRDPQNRESAPCVPPIVPRPGGETEWFAANKNSQASTCHRGKEPLR